MASAVIERREAWRAPGEGGLATLVGRMASTDVVELLKRHLARTVILRRAASKRFRTKEARERLAALVARAREEAARRR